MFKKVIAWGILGALVPLYVDVASDPYSTDPILESWARGAVKTALALTVAWAIQEASRGQEIDQA